MWRPTYLRSICHFLITCSRFKYDPVGRILDAQFPDHKESFTFDPASNLLLGDFDFLIPDKRVRMFNDWHCQFDIHGNVTHRKKISNGEKHPRAALALECFNQGRNVAPIRSQF